MTACDHDHGDDDFDNGGHGDDYADDDYDGGDR